MLFAWWLVYICTVFAKRCCVSGI